MVFKYQKGDHQHHSAGQKKDEPKYLLHGQLNNSNIISQDHEYSEDQSQEITGFSAVEQTIWHTFIQSVYIIAYSKSSLLCTKYARDESSWKRSLPQGLHTNCRTVINNAKCNKIHPHVKWSFYNSYYEQVGFCLNATATNGVLLKRISIKGQFYT